MDATTPLPEAAPREALTHITGKVYPWQLETLQRVAATHYRGNVSEALRQLLTVGIDTAGVRQ